MYRNFTDSREYYYSFFLKICTTQVQIIALVRKIKLSTRLQIKYELMGLVATKWLVPLCGIFQKASAAQVGSRAGPRPALPISVLAACSTAAPGSARDRSAPCPAAGGKDVAPSVTTSYTTTHLQCSFGNDAQYHTAAFTTTCNKQTKNTLITDLKFF